MLVVGIDPAPRKGLAVFDGRFQQFPIGKARAYVTDLTQCPDLLVCWDAPLTGPEASVVEGGNGQLTSFTQRPIESFFSRSATGYKAPEGISIRPYSGCPHWALSRHLIGLPRTGPFDRDELPFSLIASNDDRPASGRHVVEVHPALALWLWCRPFGSSRTSWDYKRDDGVRRDLWRQLLRVPEVKEIFASSCLDLPSTDDELDARVAYALGRLWLGEERQAVVLLGSLDDGTFLLPRAQGMEQAFLSFVNSLPRGRRGKAVRAT